MERSLSALHISRFCAWAIALLAGLMAIPGFADPVVQNRADKDARADNPGAIQKAPTEPSKPATPPAAQTVAPTAVKPTPRADPKGPVARPETSPRPDGARSRPHEGRRPDAHRERVWDKPDVSRRAPAQQPRPARNEPPRGGVVSLRQETKGTDGGKSPVQSNRSPARPYCDKIPDAHVWKSRDVDVLDQIKNTARRGSVPAVAIPGDATRVEGFSLFPAGWRAYRFMVPTGGKLHVLLHHTREGAFKLGLLNKWGNRVAGTIPKYTGRPEIAYTNQSKETSAIYLLVDDPSWAANCNAPYTLDIDKSWSFVVKAQVVPVDGVWGDEPENLLTAVKPDPVAPDPVAPQSAAKR